MESHKHTQHTLFHHAMTYKKVGLCTYFMKMWSIQRCTHILSLFPKSLNTIKQKWSCHCCKKVAFSKWCCLLIQCTLVYQINVQHNLLTFWKIPTCTALFHPAHFISFGKFSILHAFLLSEFLKNSILHALFHPAHFINFGKFSILHYYLID